MTKKEKIIIIVDSRIPLHKFTNSYVEAPTKISHKDGK